MRDRTRVVLLTPVEGPDLQSILDIIGARASASVVRDLASLENQVTDPETILLCFGTGVIVPVAILRRLHRPAYNFHAASPDYPGRDPHHFAIYDGAHEYGATAHVLTEKIDSGPIVGVDKFTVPPSCTPDQLMRLANCAAKRLFAKLVPLLLEQGVLPELPGYHWNPRKTTRGDFLAMCHLSPLVSENEFKRRLQAFDGGSRDNLTVDLHGRTFRIDKSVPRCEPQPVTTEFTEIAYRDMLQFLVSRGYEFASYARPPAARHVLWRHDIDLSVHRAVRLASIEAELGASATYFVNPHSSFYNMLEPAILDRLRQIRTLGHEIGLHFDATAYAGEPWTERHLDARLRQERAMLMQALGCPIDAFSYHNPDVGDLMRFDAERIAGMINVYSARLRRDYVYASDSNGYWRHKPMLDVIRESHDRLHLLTHPGWWSPEPLTPRRRIERCLLGRSRAVFEENEALLARHGRPTSNGDRRS